MNQNEAADLAKAKSLVDTLGKLAKLTAGTALGKQPVTTEDFMGYVVDLMQMFVAVGESFTLIRADIASIKDKISYGDAVLPVGELLNDLDKRMDALDGLIKGKSVNVQPLHRFE